MRAGPAGHATDSMSIDGADLERAVRRNLPLPRAPISHGSASTEQSPGSPGDALAVGGGRGKAHRSTTAVARGSSRVLAVFCRGGGLGRGCYEKARDSGAKVFRMSHGARSSSCV